MCVSLADLLVLMEISFAAFLFLPHSQKRPKVEQMSANHDDDDDANYTKFARRRKLPLTTHLHDR